MKTRIFYKTIFGIVKHEIDNFMNISAVSAFYNLSIEFGIWCGTSRAGAGIACIRNDELNNNNWARDAVCNFHAVYEKITEL